MGPSHQGPWVHVLCPNVHGPWAYYVGVLWAIFMTISPLWLWPLKEAWSSLLLARHRLGLAANMADTLSREKARQARQAKGPNIVITKAPAGWYNGPVSSWGRAQRLMGSHGARSMGPRAHTKRPWTQGP